jgi:syringomycin synthetase protein SyrE
LDGLLVPHSTVEAAAATHVRAIREVQPRGPVHLLGHSFGGWVALALAHQLRAADRSVASLTIVDAEVPDAEGALGREYTAGEAFMELIRVLELTADQSLGIDRARCETSDLLGRLQLLHEGCVRAGLMPARSQPESLRGVLRAFGTALRTRYRPRHAYAELVRLVLVSDPHGDEEGNRRQHQRAVAAWRRWAPNLTYHHAPGNHVAVLKPPHVRVLANVLQSSLELEASEHTET